LYVFHPASLTGIGGRRMPPAQARPEALICQSRVCEAATNGSGEVNQCWECWEIEARFLAETGVGCPEGLGNW